MQSRRATRIALVSTLASAMLFGAAQPAMAYFDNYLSGSILGTMTQKEAAQLQQTVRKILNETPDGQAVPWGYPAAGRRQAVDGTITPVSSKTDKGQQCRRLKADLKRGSANESWSGWFCKQSNGAWKARQVAD